MVTLFHFNADTRGVPGPETTASAAFAALQHGNLLDAAAISARAAIGLPAFRLDLLLFVTGLVLSLAPVTGAARFFRRRARSVLPNYWLGSLAVAALLVALAILRAMWHATPVDAEIRMGTLLARTPYRFEWLDLVRSMSILGRFQDARTIQVVAPSMWYIALVLQLYVIFPFLRAALKRVGPWWFLAGCATVMWAGRAIVLRHPPFAGFDGPATAVCFLPFRLLSPALGMVVARWRWLLDPIPRRALAFAGVIPALALIVVAGWVAIGVNDPGTVRGLFGSTPSLLVVLPGVWILASAILHVDRLSTIFTWIGRRSLSVLVVQDFLRISIGTLLSLGLHLERWTWWLILPYVGVAVLLVRWWEPFQVAVTNRLWASAPA